MTEFEALLVDELRREFRRTRPPAKALNGQYRAGIFRLTDGHRYGFRVFWYRPNTPPCLTIKNTLFELIEPLL